MTRNLGSDAIKGVVLLTRTTEDRSIVDVVSGELALLTSILVVVVILLLIFQLLGGGTRGLVASDGVDGAVCALGGRIVPSIGVVVILKGALALALGTFALGGGLAGAGRFGGASSRGAAALGTRGGGGAATAGTGGVGVALPEVLQDALGPVLGCETGGKANVSNG